MCLEELHSKLHIICCESKITLLKVSFYILYINISYIFIK